MFESFESMVSRLAAQLQQRGWRLAVAESCTGGWLSKVLTDQTGSSQWFDRGFVTYSNAAKQQMLNVDEALLERYGAVSEPVVAAMAEGVLREAGADLSVAISGIAGPDGGSAAKPLGTVWFAWACAGDPTQTECLVFDGNREAVRRQAVGRALQGLLALDGE